MSLPPTTAELHFRNLGESLQAVLRIIALMGGQGRTLLCTLIRAANIPQYEGKAWTEPNLAAIKRQLRARRLLTETGRCCPELEMKLSLDSVPLARTILAAIPATKLSSLVLRCRVAVFALDREAYVDASDEINRISPELFTGTPLDKLILDPAAFVLPNKIAKWYATLPPEMALDVLSANLGKLFDTGEVPAGMLQMLPRLPELRPLSRDPRIVLLDIYAGRLAEARLQLDMLPQLYQRMQFDGMIAFLSGDNKSALKLFKEAQKLYRKLVQRQFPLPGPALLCQLLTMFRTNAPDLGNKLIHALHDNRAQTEQVYKGITVINALRRLHEGRDDDAKHQLHSAATFPCREPLSEALYWATLALARTLTPDEQTKRQARADAWRSFMPLMAALIAGEPLPVQAPSPELPPAAIVVPQIDFKSWFGSTPPWENMLKKLGNVLQPAAAERDRRLIWLLDAEEGHVEAVEQKAKISRGGVLSWTPGRTVSPRYLVENCLTSDWMTEQDKKVIACIGTDHSWSGIHYSFDTAAALDALAGHPLLFSAHNREPLLLDKREIGLVLSRDSAGGHTLTLSRHPEHRNYDLEQTGPNHYTVHLLSKKLADAAGIIRNGLAIPADGTPIMLEFLDKLDPLVPLETNIQAVGLPVNSGLIARMRPRGAGLEASFVVRPFGLPDTPAVQAGEGNARMLTEMNGQILKTERNLDQEKRDMLAIVEACPSLLQQGNTGPWVFPDPESSLQAMLELRAAGENAHAALPMEWPEGETFKVVQLLPESRLTARIRSRRGNDWFSLQGELQVHEGLVLGMADLLNRMEEAKGRFLPLGNGEFLALTRSLQNRIRRLERLSEAVRGGGNGSSASERRIHPLAAAALQEALPVDAVDDKDNSFVLDSDASWLDLQRRIRELGSAPPAPIPAGLKATLREYQVTGFQWLMRLASWGAGACLADDMGLGKTVQTIAAMLALVENGLAPNNPDIRTPGKNTAEPGSPILVVAPTSVCHNWHNEIAQFAPGLHTHQFGALTAKQDRKALAATLGPTDVLVCSYGLLHTETDTLASRKWRMVVFDEAQAMKNADTKRAKAAQRLHGQFRVILTGTPIENYLEDLWSLFNIINPGLLGTRQSFQKRFSRPATDDNQASDTPGSTPEHGSDLPGSAPTDAVSSRQILKALIRPFILRRTKEEVLKELPPITEQVLLVDMPDDERAFYEAVRRKALENLETDKIGDGANKKFAILAELTRLRRACCHPALIAPESNLPGAKRQAFMELVQQLRQGGHRALVFSQFVGHLTLLRKALDAEGIAYQYLDGSTPEKNRRKSVDAFQQGAGLLFLISLKAGGQGLNLTAADYVIHMDPWWNPAVEDQASDRAHRIGQKRPVTVYRLVMRDSVEEKILDMHAKKRNLAADFLEGTSVPLSEEELLALFR